MKTIVEVFNYEVYSPVYQEFDTKEEAEVYINSLQVCVGRIVKLNALAALGEKE